jgi:hypothetical protein
MKNGYRFMKVSKQQMSCNRIKKDYSDKQKSGADKAEYHISGRCDKRFALVIRHKERAGSNSTYLNKNVSGKNIVRVAKRRKSRMAKIYHHIEKLLLIFCYFGKNSSFSAYNGKQHNDFENKNKKRLKKSRRNLVSDGRIVMTHSVNEISTLGKEVVRNYGRGHNDAHAKQKIRRKACSSSLK